jgi:hypothetical protein
VTYYAGGFSVAGVSTPAYAILLTPDLTGATTPQGIAYGVDTPTGLGFTLVVGGGFPSTHLWMIAIGSKT